MIVYAFSHAWPPLSPETEVRRGPVYVCSSCGSRYTPGQIWVREAEHVGGVPGGSPFNARGEAICYRITTIAGLAIACGTKLQREESPWRCR